QGQGSHRPRRGAAPRRRPARRARVLRDHHRHRGPRRGDARVRREAPAEIPGEIDAMSHDHTAAELAARAAKARAGGAEKSHRKNAEEGKLFCRERLARLCDDGAPFVEDALLANCEAPDLPADGVVTGVGRIHGRPVAVMANDSTVKAGSWGARTVEK